MYYQQGFPAEASNGANWDGSQAQWGASYDQEGMGMTIGMGDGSIAGSATSAAHASYDTGHVSGHGQQTEVPQDPAAVFGFRTASSPSHESEIPSDGNASPER